MQGGLEIPIRVKGIWPLLEKLSIYIKYAVIGEYVDNSKEILKEPVGPETVESLDDEDEEPGDTEDENSEDNEIIE